MTNATFRPRLLGLALCALAATLSLSGCSGDDDADADDMMGGGAVECPTNFIAYSLGDTDYCGAANVIIANGGGADSYNFNVTADGTSLSLTGIIAPEVGTLTVGGEFSFDPPFADATGRVTVAGTEYVAETDNPGTLTITEIDGDDRFEATFEFEAVNPDDAGDRVEVTGGVVSAR